MAFPVHRVTSKVGRSFLVEHRGVLTLIDAGAPGSATRVLSALRKLGRKPQEVRQILLTHCHGDHAGDARRLREACDAPTVAGAADVGVIEGRDPYPLPKTALSRSMYGGLANYPRFQVERATEGKTEVDGGLFMVPSPGHTAGHMAVFAPDLGALFLGDAVWNIVSLRVSWGMFTQDPDRNQESIRELADLPAQALFFGHGPAIRRDGRARLSSLVR